MEVSLLLVGIWNKRSFKVPSDPNQPRICDLGALLRQLRALGRFGHEFLSSGRQIPFPGEPQGAAGWTEQ